MLNLQVLSLSSNLLEELPEALSNMHRYGFTPIVVLINVSCFTFHFLLTV
jgi:hypothetical protein